MKRFYSVIIGTELLNGRRQDSHFEFVNSEILKRGWEHHGSFIISDDPKLIESTFRFIKSDPDSVMFSFGGIGATPDDYTREIAGLVFGDGEMEFNQEAKEIILDRFGENAYPNRIQMSYLPKGAGLLQNPINRVPGFYVDKRFFFVPGFPEMARAMVVEAMERFYNFGQKKYRKVLFIEKSEENLISFMKTIPNSIEVSSLPTMRELEGSSYKPATYIALSGYDCTEVEDHFERLIGLVKSNGWIHNEEKI